MKTTSAARAFATGLFALLTGLASCKSSPSGSDSGGTFCDAAKSAVTTCQDATACDTALTSACAKLDAVVSTSTLDTARDCLESGVCGAASCLSRGQKGALPSPAHALLAQDFCATCAPDVVDCQAQFYVRGKKLPGLLVLPYADAVVSAVDAECTGTSGCQGKFTACVNDVVARVAAGSLDADVADCVAQNLKSYTGDSPTGPGGAPQVATCTAQNCPGCCRNDKCETGTLATGCGGGAAACQVCSGQQTCIAGKCKEPCGPNNCAGCCDGDTCVVGTNNDKCGGAGAACTACGASQVCSKKQCIDATCQSICTNGCCSAQGCQVGTAANACGTGGEACVDCGFGRRCTSGACVIDPNALWDFYVSFAVIPDTNKSGGSWDALGGLPDPYLKAFSSAGASSHSGKTSTLQDTTFPFWAETPLLGIKASELMSNLSFEVWDEDTVLDDFIGGCGITLFPGAFDGSLLDLTCPATASGVSVHLYFRINPHK